MTALLLWDVDHTLVDNSGISKAIYADAFVQVTGVPASEAARTDGRTDRRIMADLLTSQGYRVPDWSVVDAALQRAGAARAEQMRSRGTVLPGVRELLQAVDDTRTYLQTLLTGNVRANAAMKVRVLGLDHFFDLSAGAYGADSTDRADLVPIAIDRAERKYGTTFRGHVVLIGDTPHDVRAGMLNGVSVLAVASGAHTIEQLYADENNVLVCTDLRNTQWALTALKKLAVI